MVGTVAGDGVPRFLSDVRSLSGSLLDSPFSISDSPLVGLSLLVRKGFVSCPTAASVLCPRTSWKLSSSSTFRPGGKAAAFNTPRMVLQHPPAAAQSKSTLYVSHRPSRPLQGLKVLPHLLPSFLLSMELTFVRIVCSSRSNATASTRKPAVVMATLLNSIL